MKKMILALLLALSLPLAVGHAELRPRDNDRILASTAGDTAAKAVAGQVATRMGFYPATSSICAPETCDDYYKANVWSGLSYNYFYKTGPAALVGGQTLGQVGFDKWASDNLLLGFVVGGERFNFSGPGEARRKTAALTVLPYLGYRINDSLALDASIGHSWMDTNVWPEDSDEAIYESRAQRFTTAAGLTKAGLFGPLAVSGRLGGLYLHQSKTYDQAMRPSEDGWHLFQTSLSGRVVYLAGDFRPHFGLTYLQDFGRSGIDTAEADFNLGFTWAMTACSDLVLESVYGVRENMNKYGGRLALQLNF
ncbi:MAG: autotransporter outer membrane beta-barrel domain-containing protein [Candidatus Adiutrix sp.]|jgi:hypothetical protein|nr:autotransporter outer membrane beta-barrel domain-containing protein [Candidatus Adiutrix sp.]